MQWLTTLRSTWEGQGNISLFIFFRVLVCFVYYMGGGSSEFDKYLSGTSSM